MMPAARLLRLVAALGLPFVLGIWWPVFTSLALTLLLGLVVASLVDLLRTPTLRLIDVSRHSADVLSVGARNPITLIVRNRARLPVVLQLHDEPPQPSAWDGLPATISVPPGMRASFIYGLTPFRRGRNAFGKVMIRMTTRWKLWTVFDERNIPFAVRIYPDYQTVRQVELLARQNRLAESGLRIQSRMRGRGSEFERLREYRREDEFRSIDWKATARQQQLISREYVFERNQNIILLLDAGRSMCNSQEDVTHFDRALNAAMLLAYVALRQGDTVGLLAMNRQLVRWVRPVRGMGGVQSLIRQTYDIEPEPVATDYELMAEELRRRYRKRSLVILFTHALDDLHFQMIGTPLRRLRSPHLVLAAFLENVPLAERANSIPTSAPDAFQVAAAAEMLAAQSQQIAMLERTGLLVLKTPPDQLTSRVISRYLEVKARHLL